MSGQSGTFKIRKPLTRVEYDAKIIAELIQANVPAPMCAIFITDLSNRLQLSIEAGCSLSDVMKEAHTILIQILIQKILQQT